MTKKSTFFTASFSQTKKTGKLLAKEILEGGVFQKAFVLGLIGDLGGGKTTFLQGFARGLGIKQKILSPTFIILKKFQIPASRFRHFYHIDCYRIEKIQEILDLGLREIISDPKNIVAIEWADKIRKILPKKMIEINFKFIGKNTRRIDKPIN